MERGQIERQRERNQCFHFFSEISYWRKDRKKKKRYRMMKRRHGMDLEETTKDRGMRQILVVTMQKPVLITIHFNQHSTKTLLFLLQFKLKHSRLLYARKIIISLRFLRVQICQNIWVCTSPLPRWSIHLTPNFHWKHVRCVAAPIRFCSAVQQSPPVMVWIRHGAVW